MTTPTTAEYIEALRSMRRPGGRQLQFLRAHSDAPGRASTTSRLAEAAGYRNYRPINLHYGKLARRVGDALGRQNAPLELLVEVALPQSISNREWILIMRQEFEAALKAEGWI
jgi:hypothetical protein